MLAAKQLILSMKFSKPISPFLVAKQSSYGSRAHGRNPPVGFTLRIKLFHAMYPQLPPYLEISVCPELDVLIWTLVSFKNDQFLY